MKVNIREVGSALGLPASASNEQIRETALGVSAAIERALDARTPSHEAHLVQSFPGVVAKLGITARTVEGVDASPLPNREAGARNNVESGEAKRQRRERAAYEQSDRDAAVYAWLTGSSRAPAQTLRY